MSTPELLAEHDGALAYLATWRALLDFVPACDLLLVDAPYSDKTHAGHDSGVSPSRLEGEERRQRTDRRTGARYSVGVNRRRTIPYDAWTSDEVNAFVAAWSPRTRGWFVTITDHVLQPAWSAALEEAGRYVFAPLPFVHRGAGVRLRGDGPSSWAKWIVVARPRSDVFASWGTLDGAYVLPPGMSADLPVVGGKPPWLMQRLIEDYSRPGDLVCDPCMGAGTTLVGAIRSGRRAVGGDMLRGHAELAATWIRHPHRPAPSIERADAGAPQLKLLP